MEAKRRSSPCARGCSFACLSAFIQVIAAIIIIGAALYASSITLEWVQLIGITSIPPGVAYARVDSRM